jgi:uncharacterized protein (TIGR03067 family)
MIRIRFLWALLGSMGPLFLNHPAGADGFKKEVNRKLIGTWKVVSAERDGKTPGQAITATPWVITGTTFTARLPREGKGKFAYRLGGTDQRRTIDIEVLESQWVDLGPRRRVYRGIYALEGNNLKICYGPAYGAEKERPTGFSAQPGSGNTLFVLTRHPGSPKGQ